MVDRTSNPWIHGPNGDTVPRMRDLWKRIAPGTDDVVLMTQVSAVLAEAAAEIETLREMYTMRNADANRAFGEVERLRAENDSGNAARLIVAELLALVPLAEILEAGRTGATMVEWFKRRLASETNEPSAYAGDSIAKLIEDMSAAEAAAKTNQRESVALFVAQWIERLRTLATRSAPESDGMADAAENFRKGWEAGHAARSAPETNAGPNPFVAATTLSYGVVEVEDDGDGFECYMRFRSMADATAAFKAIVKLRKGRSLEKSESRCAQADPSEARQCDLAEGHDGQHFAKTMAGSVLWDRSFDKKPCQHLNRYWADGCPVECTDCGAVLQPAAAGKIAKCDGNHGGPRCADPECWNDDACATELYKATGHYPTCGVGEGTQRGICDCRTRAASETGGNHGK